MISASPGLTAVRRRIRIALLANLFARSVRVAEQLILVPLLLSNWGAQSYGEWLALGALAGFAPIANLGIGHAAAADIILKAARGELARASSVVVTSLVATSLSIVAGLMVFWLVLALTGVETVLGLSRSDPGLALIVMTLASALLLTTLSEPLAGALSAVRGAGLPSGIAAFSKTIELVSIGLALRAGMTPLVVAAIMLAGAALNVALHFASTACSVSWLSFSPAHVDFQIMARIAQPAAGFFVIFVCLNIFSVYLPRILVSHTLGPVALATFSVLVTYTKTARNLATMTSQATQVEIGRLWAGGDLSGARSITQRMLRQAALLAALLLAGALALAPLVIPRWTGGNIALDWPLMASLALVALIGAYFDGLLLATGALNRVALVATGYAAGLAIALTGAMVLLPLTGRLATIGVCLLLPEIGGIISGRRTLRSLGATSK